MELVVEDRRLRGLLLGRVAERLPHVHHREPEARAPRRAEEVVEHGHAFFRSFNAPEPNGLLPLQVADNDPVDVTLANRDLVNPDDGEPQFAGARQLRPHVELVHLLDRGPVEPQIRRHLINRRTPALLTDREREALGVMRIRGEPVETLPLRAAAAPTGDAPQIELEIDPQVSAREIADATQLAVVPGPLDSVAGAADCFSRRVSVTTRACGSPTIPRVVRFGRKPGNRYASRSSRLGGRREVMHELRLRQAPRQAPLSPMKTRVHARPTSPKSTHSFP